jgi:hypothetical protein
VDLHGTVDDAVEAVGDEMLGHGDLGAEVLTTVDLVGRVQHHELALVQLHGRVRDEPLHALLLGQERAVGVPVQGAIDHHVERRFRLRDPAHAVGEPGRPEAVLPEAMTVATAAEDLRVVHA